MRNVSFDCNSCFLEVCKAFTHLDFLEFSAMTLLTQIMSFTDWLSDEKEELTSDLIWLYNRQDKHSSENHKEMDYVSSIRDLNVMIKTQ